MYMLKLFLFSALMDLPFILLIGGGCFFAFRALLKCRYRTIMIITKLIVVLVICAAAIGTTYGLLRYNGVIVYPEDNFYSYHWFDSSYGDEGYDIIRFFASVLIGTVAALLTEWKAPQLAA